MSVQNKALVASYFDEIWNNRNYAYCYQVMATTHHSHNHPSGLPQGIEGISSFAALYHTAFPNLWMRIDFQVAEGDLVVTRWTCGGSHTGDLTGIPATYHNIEITGVQIDRIECGKIAESWGNYDLYGLMQQIEALPSNQ